MITEAYQTQGFNWTEAASTGTMTLHIQKQWIWRHYKILSGFLQLFYEPSIGLDLVQNPPNFPPKYFENSQKICHLPNAIFTHQPNTKLPNFSEK